MSTPDFIPITPDNAGKIPFPCWLWVPLHGEKWIWYHFQLPVNIVNATFYCLSSTKPEGVPETFMPNEKLTCPTNEKFIAAFRDMQAAVYACHEAKGWTKDVNPNDHAWRGLQIALMHSELSEALEGQRKKLKDDKLPHREMVEVELADVIIRIMNFATQTGMDVAGALVEKSDYNLGRPYKHGDKSF